jgi:hypothetical protein
MTWLYIARVKLTSRHPAAPDQCARELCQTKSRIWHCGADSSQTLSASVGLVLLLLCLVNRQETVQNVRVLKPRAGTDGGPTARR